MGGREGAVWRGVLSNISKNTNGDETTAPMLVDFSTPEFYGRTTPVTCRLNDAEVKIQGRQNWVQMLVAITEKFIKEGKTEISELTRKSLYHKVSKEASDGKSTQKPFLLSSRPPQEINAARLSNGKWINVKFNIPNLVRIIGILCTRCGVNIEDVKITCVYKQQAIATRPPKRPTPEKSADSSSDILWVTDVLSLWFSNGFRIESPIELSRFRRFSAEKNGEELRFSDEKLSKIIISCGILFDGKIYVVTEKTKDNIKSLVDKAVSGGAGLIFYESFYEKHEDWLFSVNIISEDMLKRLLVKLYPHFAHRENYLSPDTESGAELAKIKREILRVWGDDVLLNYDQLAERMPYGPIDKIKFALAHNGEFIWNTADVYTHVGKINISAEERAAITEYVGATCRTEGYASLSDVPLGEIEERNYELSVAAIHNAVFYICLAGTFTRNGKIITRKGDTLKALVIMKEYCSGLDKCSLQDLLDFEQKLTGEVHRWIPMEAGYAVMVRTDKDSYVAEQYVHFDVAAIDDAIDLFVTGEYLPLRHVTTFAAFPHCGQPWNLFLLKSYCRRFSDRFRFAVLSVNSKNAGTIVRKTSLLTYEDIVADAVAKSGSVLERNAVLDYLFENGYTGVRKYSKLEALTQQAKALRERER
jgi:hypothetical protein